LTSSFYFEISPWWIVPILLGVSGAVWVFYFSSREFEKSQRWALAALRFLTLFVIAILLLAPLLKSSERVDEKPLLLWLEDHSSSVISLPDSQEVRNFLKNELPGIADELEDKYELRKLDFSTSLHEHQPDSFPGLQTDIATAVQAVRQRYYNQNVGGLVLVSDGIYNRGINPVYEAESSPFPVFTLGLGDTTVKQDLFIEKLVHNELTYLNNQFPLEINLRARKMDGRSYSLNVTDSRGKSVFSKAGTVSGENFFEKVETYLPAVEVGVQRYTVSVDAGVEEQMSNNRQTFSIEVIDNRKKIRIAGSSPHPDMAAIATALDKLEKYEVESGLWGAFSPQDKEPDLYILFGPRADMLEAIGKKPYWLIDLPSSDKAAFGRRSGVQPGTGAIEQVRVVPERGFSLFNLSNESSDFLKNLPPLQIPYGRIQPGGGSQAFLYKKVGQVETQEPIWFFRTEDQQRSSVLLANGLWEWRMYDYRQNNSFENFDELIAQTVQYLTARTEDQRFVVEAESRYNNRESIVMTARLYNLSLELDNSPEVEMSIRSDEGKEYQFNFSKTTNAYRLNAGSLPPGSYTWTATTQLGEDQFSRSGAFAVEMIRVEQADLVARHEVLRAISRESGGKFYNRQQAKEMMADLMENSSAKGIQRLKTSISSLLNKKLLFFILLIFLTAEWGLRKYFGKY
tara:strand:+ start:6279 stop:8327 length:2049 start_codon:yes stop_codon:yes gene_type:complete